MHGFGNENLLTEKARKVWLFWRQNLSDKDKWLEPDPDHYPPEVKEFIQEFRWDELRKPQRGGTIHLSAASAGNSRWPMHRAPARKTVRSCSSAARSDPRRSRFSSPRGRARIRPQVGGVVPETQERILAGAQLEEIQIGRASCRERV